MALCAHLSGMFWAIGLLQTQLAAPPTNLPVVPKLESSAPIQERQQPLFTLPSRHPPKQPSRQQAGSAYPTLNSQQFDQQIQRFLHYLAESGPLDILIVGSSRALQGIDPLVLQRMLVSQSDRDLKIFNFGVNGATAQVVDLILRRLLTPEQLPRLIIWADGVRAFNSGRVDLTYNGVLASQGYQLLAAGVRPSPPISPTQPELFCIDFPSSSFAATPFIDRLLKQGKPADKHVPVFSRSKARWLCDRQLQDTLGFDPSGQPKAQTIKLHEAVGFRAVPTKFNPANYFRRYPKVPGNYDADYRNFSLQGQQTTALNNVLTFAQARQIPVIFVSLPLTQIYLDNARSHHEEQFRAYMQKFAQTNRLTFHDFSRRWSTQNDYFMDPSHLNQYGAAVVAAQLSKELKNVIVNLEVPTFQRDKI